MLKRLGYLLTLVGLGSTLLVAPVGAINVFDDCAANPDAQVCKAANTDDATSLIRNIINTLLYLIGSVSVIMIIVGGIRYTTSNGEPGQIKAAKDTIMYAVIGLAVAIFAYAIVQFVIMIFA